MSEYLKYQHVEKLGSDETEGIEFGTCYIFPKVDGTNAHVWLDSEGEVHYGSRRRELSLEEDNAGFMNWAIDQAALHKALLTFGTGAHIYGEWLVPHSLKTYREDAWRKFYVFDVWIDGKHLAFDQYEPVLKECGVDYINPLRILKNPKLEDVEKCLKENTFLIEDGSGFGEGVVVKNYDWVNRFGRQTWAKLVTSEFKEKHVKAMGAPVSACTAYVEQEIVDKFLTPEIIRKVYANIKNECGWTTKMIPRLLNTVYYDFVRECTWEFVKDKKNPSVDFKVLQRFVFSKTKLELAELF